HNGIPIIRTAPPAPGVSLRHGERLHAYNLHYVGAPAYRHRWRAAAQGCAFCSERLGQPLANTAHKRQRPATVQPAGFFFSCRALLRQTTL
ncbi:hypothetical protein, partial [Xenorhabdus littoralis]|uniref:hypothetical protein n=1 Tax=Xenorhabdus littoralis TaxID=2582835 RepID=UPI0029E7D8AC